MMQKDAVARARRKYLLHIMLVPRGKLVLRILVDDHTALCVLCTVH